MEPQNFISYLAFFIGALVAIRARIAFAFTVVAALTFAPFFRLSLNVGAVPLGVRPEDVMLPILTLRGFCSKRRPPGDTHLGAFQARYAALLLIIGISLAYTLATTPASTINFYMPQKLIGATMLLYIGVKSVRTVKHYRTFLLWAGLGAVSMCTAVLFAPHQEHAGAYSSLGNTDMYNYKLDNVQFLSGWNPNAVGMVAGAFLLLLAPLSFDRAKWIVRFCVLAAMLPISLVLLRSYSRTALIAAAAGIIYIAAQSTKSRRVLIGLSLGPAIAGLAAFIDFRTESLQIDLSQNVNTGDRVHYWEMASLAIKETPWGYGVGVEDLALGGLVGDKERASAHNDWFDFALGIGVLGAAFAVWTFYALYAFVWKNLNLPRGPGGFAVGAKAVLIFFLVYSLAGQVYTFNKIPFVFFAAFLGLAASYHEESKAANERRRLRWTSLPAQTPVGSAA